MPRFLFLPIYSFTLWDAKHAPQGDMAIHITLTFAYKEREDLEVILFCRAIFRPIIFHPL